MHRNVIFVAVIELFLSLAVFGQISEEEILTLLERHELAITRERINQTYRQYPNSAVAAYFHAMLEQDGETASKYFQDIASRFPGTVYAERALFRLGQYHFAQGTYNRARQYFLSLIEQYPKSILLPQANYYAAKSLVIIGMPTGVELSQAREELSRCVEKYPGTWVAKFAAEDLAKLPSLTAAPKQKPSEPPPPTPKKLKGIYTVDIGAFDSREKAAREQAVFSKAGYPTEISEERRGRKIFYKVLVGDFTDRSQARKFSDDLQRKYKVKSHVVKR
ncbi:MAG: SPOR domain-containing protein [candidate division KSB1 bacterium]|nr:SPOR domain-containing protein [candidate division KSB1 bacterium]MDZ7366735.1 SPOR domain-containing protein [candidate division KSB1 bacterium]MDZ7404748.1 SPOR domain-containing protein [candidate division KSB1 bacterium]